MNNTAVQKRVALDQAGRVRIAWIARALQEWFGCTVPETQQFALQRRALEVYVSHLEATMVRDDGMRELAIAVERQRVRTARKGTADLLVPLDGLQGELDVEPLRTLSGIVKDYRAKLPPLLGDWWVRRNTNSNTKGDTGEQ